MNISINRCNFAGILTMNLIRNYVARISAYAVNPCITVQFYPKVD